MDENACINPKNDNTFYFAIGTTNSFYKRCPVCGEITVNGWADEIKDNIMNTFECKHCGKKSKAHSYLLINGRFSGFNLQHTSHVYCEYNGKEYVCIIMDEKNVLLIKPGKTKLVKAKHVDRIMESYKDKHDEAEAINSSKAMWQRGYHIGLCLCPSCKTLNVSTMIKNLGSIDSVNCYECCVCGKRWKEYRRGVHKDKQGRDRIAKLWSVLRYKHKKTGNIVFGVNVGYAVFWVRDGKQFKRDTTEFDRLYEQGVD
jgi:DNA-directed RNA polymerase subunit M/transcription elongation factor TFIIS